MPAKISLHDARIERMRGNIEDQLIQPDEPKEAPQVKPEPVKEVAPAQVVIDMTPVANAVQQSGQLQAQMLGQMAQMLKDEPAAQIKKWTFKITERDRMGNIITFTAEAQ